MVNAKRTKTGNYLVLIQGGLSGKESQNKTICPGPQQSCQSQDESWRAMALAWRIMKRLVS